MNEQSHFATWVFYTARIWGFFALLLLSSVYAEATRPYTSPLDTTDFPLDKLLKVLEQRANTRWAFDHEFDPITNEQTLRADPENMQYLSLNANGTYMVYDEYDTKEGIWEVDMPNQTITFWCKRVNGSMTQTNQPGTYKVKIFNDRQLVLGRRGQLDKVYRLN